MAIRVNIKAKIWYTVTAVVLLFAYFIYFYFPSKQKEEILQGHHKTTQNQVNTVALGVQIALDEQNFKGVSMAMDYVKKDSNLIFVAIVQEVPYVDGNGDTLLNYSPFQTFPKDFKLKIPYKSSDSVVIKEAPFRSEMLRGKIVLGMSTRIVKAQFEEHRKTAIIITISVLSIGVLIGFLLARSISNALKKLSHAASKVAAGDLKSRIELNRGDEIGDLAIAFDNMINSLENADAQIKEYNEELKAQYEIVEFHNAKTQESIRYAQNIQNAFLPPLKRFKESFDDFFISYLPKDVVSGDFYFYEEIKGRHIVGAFDCTGHGVPGGFMSVMGAVYLRNIVTAQKECAPEAILTKLQDGIVSSLNQNEETVRSKDGMDGSLCSIDLETREMCFAGAYNSLYILRGDEWITIKANRRSVAGGSDYRDKEFTKHSVQLQKGDMLYMMSDGLIDQFGELSGKKFMIRRFKECVEKYKDLSMADQKLHLEKSLKNWQGQEMQIDDILVMGLKIP